jgi:DHA1 family tetracycline resistance protein-like MFS transporter
MMTRRVSESEQGELQGAISSLRSLAVIVGPGLFTFVFALFIDQKRGWNVPGAPWYLGAALLFVAMLMSTRVKKLPPSDPLTGPERETVEPARIVNPLSPSTPPLADS